MTNYILWISMALLVAGCASNATYIAADGTVISTSRSAPERMVDVGIERSALKGLDNIVGLTSSNHRVSITAFRGEVLLTGEVPSEDIKQRIGTMVESIKEVTEVFNYLTVADTPKSQSHTVHENYLKTKIESKLVTSKIKSSQYHIVVRNDIAYVMGYLTKAQQDKVIEAVTSTDGLAGLYLLSTLLLTEEELEAGSYTQESNYPQTGSYPDNEAAVSQSSAQSSYVQLYQNTDNP